MSLSKARSVPEKLIWILMDKDPQSCLRHYLGFRCPSPGYSQTDPVPDWQVLGLTHPPDVALLHLVAEDHVLQRGGYFQDEGKGRHINFKSKQTKYT